jgi:hypothetical protein
MFEATKGIPHGRLKVGAKNSLEPVGTAITFSKNVQQFNVAVLRGGQLPCAKLRFIQYGGVRSLI